jgi:glucosylceramidase
MQEIPVHTGAAAPEEYQYRAATVVGTGHASVIGFGGAFTDSTAVNLETLEEPLAEAVLHDYFGEDYLRFSLGRVPMASCDFSERQYTYRAAEDAPFALALEDVGPIGTQTPDGRTVTWSRERMLRRALELRNGALRLFASPWTAPPWMKEGQEIPPRARNMHHDRHGNPIPYEKALPWVGGHLRTSAREAWAQYFAEFFKAFADRGIPFWGLTVQNEPHALPDDKVQHWETMFWTPEETRDFVRDHLGPVLHCEEGHRLPFCDHLAEYLAGIHVMVHDDQKPSLPGAVRPILQDAAAMKYVSGVGVHWYMAPPLEDISRNLRVRGADIFVSVFKNPVLTVGSLYEELQAARPGTFVLGTEACNGFYPDPDNHEANGAAARLVFGRDPTTHVVQGSFQRGETYAEDILADLANSASGWTDWNLVLDSAGGPNWAGNFVDAPVLVPDAHRYVRQPSFYYLGHFSRFLPPGARFVRTQQPNMGKPGRFELEPSKLRSFLRPMHHYPGNFFLQVFCVPAEDGGDDHFVVLVLNRRKVEEKWSVEQAGEAELGEIPGQSIQTVLWKPKEGPRCDALGPSAPLNAEAYSSVSSPSSESLLQAAENHAQTERLQPLGAGAELPQTGAESLLRAEQKLPQTEDEPQDCSVAREDGE